MNASPAPASSRSVEKKPSFLVSSDALRLAGGQQQQLASMAAEAHRLGVGDSGALNLQLRLWEDRATPMELRLWEDCATSMDASLTDPTVASPPASAAARQEQRADNDEAGRAFF